MVQQPRYAAACAVAVLVTACHWPSHQAAGAEVAGSKVAPAGPDDVYARLHSASRAHALADAAVAGLAMPPGTVVGSTPRLTLAELAGPMILTRADGLRTWRLPGGGDPAIAWLTAHPPKGEKFLVAKVSPAWPAELTAETTHGDEPPTIQLNLRVTPKQDGTEVFADATVLFSPARSAAEAVPTVVSSATLDYARPRAVSHWVVPGRKPSHVDVVRPELRVQRTLTAHEMSAVATVLNASLVQAPSPPDMAPSCTPADERATLTFAFAGHRASFAASFEGCHDIDVTVDGKRQPTLDGGSALGAVIRPMVGLPSDPSTPYARARSGQAHRRMPD